MKVILFADSFWNKLLNNDFQFLTRLLQKGLYVYPSEGNAGPRRPMLCHLFSIWMANSLNTDPAKSCIMNLMPLHFLMNAAIEDISLSQVPLLKKGL